MKLLHRKLKPAALGKATGEAGGDIGLVPHFWGDWTQETAGLVSSRALTGTEALTRQQRLRSLTLNVCRRRGER